MSKPSTAERAPTPSLAALATAIPSHHLAQDDIADHARRVFGLRDVAFDRLAGVYRNAQIEQRHASAPLEWFLENRSFPERNALFLQSATALLTEAAEKALAEAGLAAGDIDTIVTVCSSGIATPSLEARVMGALPFRADVQRLPIFGLGCAGGVMGMARAAAMAMAEPSSRVLLLVVELCSLTFRLGDRSKSNLVATALFGDGAAAAVITCRPEVADTAPRLGPWGEHTWPGSLDVMGWDMAEDGMKVVFSRDIPTLVKEDLRPVVDTFLARHGLTLGQIDDFVCHPGGAKVVDALEDCFDLDRGALADARQTLRDHGNMSAATVLFVLRLALDAGDGGRRLMTTLGPGFTAAMMVIDA